MCSPLSFIHIVLITGTYLVEFVLALTMIKDSSSAEIVFRCLVIPPDIPPEQQSSVVFDNIPEEEAITSQCMPDSPLDEPGHRLICDFQ